MRILVLTSTFPRWAGDREPPFVFELCRRLAAGHEVHVVAPHCRGAARSEMFGERLHVQRFRYAPEFLESLAYEGGILQRLKSARWRLALVPLFLVAEWWSSVRALRRVGPDIVHAHAIIPHGVLALCARLARGNRPPVLSTAHGGDLFALRGALGSAMKRWVVRRSDQLTVVSAAMKDEAMRLGAAAGRIRVMPMGIDARERFTPLRQARAGDEILFVGRLVPKKGLAHLLEALVAVRKAAPNAHLTIVGSGPLERDLRARAATLGLAQAVRFEGAVPNEELAVFYRRAAVFAMPSVVTAEGDQEGLGLVAAEAMACECPVVASDLPAVHDIVQDGVSGLLARPGDPAQLAEKILGVLADPALASRLGTAGRRVVLERFDWASVAQGYERLLTQLAAGAA